MKQLVWRRVPLQHYQITINLHSMGKIEKTGCQTEKREEKRINTLQEITDCMAKIDSSLDPHCVMNNVEIIYFPT